MGGHCIGFLIMTHCCSITLEIKSKTLNFNQVTLVTALKKMVTLPPLASRENDFERQESESKTEEDCTPGETA